MSSSEYQRKKAMLAEIEAKNSEYEKKSKQPQKVKEIATLDSVKKKKETKKKSTYKPMSMVYKELRESRKEKPNEGAFDDNYEQELIKSLFKDDNKKSKDTSEVQEPEQVVEEKPKKRTGEWDYTLDDEIKFFDPECSYELTGYKPITETKGLNFNPDWFTETSRIYDETGQYTEYPKGSKPYADFWDEQFERCKEGYEVNGYRITGDNYFFLNFYRMQTIVEGRIAGKGRNEKFPSFFAKQYEFFHYVEMAEKLHKDVTILKARGLGLSEQVASMLVRPYTTNRGYKSLLTAPDAPKLKSTKDKCWKQLNWLDMYTNGGMRHVRQKVNNDDCKRASKVNKEGTEFGWMSEINTVIADSADKIRGDRLDRLVFEECFGKGTKVIMSDYTRKNIEDIKVGDFVMGIDGTPQEVIRTCGGIDQLYRIIQRKGEDYIVNSAHKLYLEHRPRVGKHQDKVKLITCADYFELSEYNKRTTYGLKSSGLLFNNTCDLDPYFFGLWIGDGFSAGTTIIINETDDQEIKDYVLNYFNKFPDHHISVRLSSTTKRRLTDKLLNIYSLSKDKGHINVLREQYKKYNLINNKHIPQNIYFSSINFRLKVLAGIIDTDGNLIKGTSSYNFGYEVAMSRKELILEIAELARSCGFYVHYSERNMKWGYKKDSISYRISIRGQIWKIPVLIKRKKIPTDYSQTTNALSTSIKIEPYKYGEYYGFTLRSYGKNTDNLFLLNDYTIVHNCGSNRILTESWIKSNALVELGGEHFGTRISLGTGWTTATYVSNNVWKIE